VDYLWFGDARAKQYLDKLVPPTAQAFESRANLRTGGIVTSIHTNWLDNAFMYGPTLSALVYPKVSGQQAILDQAAQKVGGGSINDYYSGSWIAIATLTMNGDLAKIKGLVSGGSTPVSQPTPRPVPVAQPTPRPVPVAQPTPRPVPVAQPTPRPVPVAQPTPRPVPVAPRPVPVAQPTPRPAPVAQPTPRPVPVSCAGVAYASPASNDWWVAVTGVPVSSKSVVLQCSSGHTVTCTKIDSWGDKFGCQSAGQPCPKARSVVFDGTTCALANNNQRLEDGEERTNEESEAWPVSSIAMLVVGCVGCVLVLVVIALLVRQRSLRDSERV
jgi:hypothetical protein